MHDEKRLPLGKQLLYQLLCLLIAAIVLYPILWVVAISFDARDIQRPTELIPPEFSLQAYQRVLTQPTSNPVSFLTLAKNSLLLASGVALFSVLIGVSAAYIFSRFDFRLRKVLMVAVLGVLMMPSIATIAPLFVLLNKISFNTGEIQFNLRNSLLGVGMAMISGALPFAIWNLKGYLDTIPKDLAEAAMIDGASFNQVFIRIILPLARPALAVTFFLGFLTGWTEFAISWQFLTNPQDFTLSMALWNMTGQYSGDTPWSAFAAMALMLSLPVALVYLAFQRQIVSGLTMGSVK
ncbi:MAG: ABC transporter permease subunit [Anaerolineae bacterium]|nr:ABC transporter permease subunit [Anaerolineae bacterium]